MTSTVKSHQWDPQHHFEERLVKLASSSLAENLLDCSFSSTTDEDGKPDPDLTDKLMKQISFDIKRRKSLLADSKKDSRRHLTDEDHTSSSTITADDSLSDGELLQRVREEGFLQWKEQGSSSLPTLTKPSSKKSSQMSLFLSQLNSGGGLQSIMSWDRIQEDSQGDEAVQLQMLKDVQHIQDIVPDWELHVKSFFLQGLRTPQEGFIDLHRQWFDQSRHSTEFRTLQIDLCQNLVTAIEEQSLLVSTSKNPMNEENLRSMVDLTLDMFEDWMLRGIYVHDNRVWSIGRTLWGWLLHDSNEYKKNESLSPVTRCMVQVDGSASWFSSWTAHLSPDQCLELVSSQDLSRVIAWCDAHLQESDKTSMDQSTFYFWLNVLHSVIVSTRVARFPWHLVSSATNGKSKKLLIFHLFLAFFRDTDDPDKMNMCADAVETILMGCREDEAFEKMLEEVKILREKDHLREYLLQRMMTRVEEAL